MQLDRGYTLLEMMVVLLVLSVASLVHLRWEWQQLESITQLELRHKAWLAAQDRLEAFSGFATLTPQGETGSVDFQSLGNGVSGSRAWDESWQVTSPGPGQSKHLAVQVRWYTGGREQAIELERHLAAVGRTWQ